MMRFPAARFFTWPFPPFTLAALRLAAAIRVPRVFFAIFVLLLFFLSRYTLSERMR